MSDYLSRSLAAVSSWHRNVYESYDEPDDEGWFCPDCGEWVEPFEEHTCE